MISLRQSIKELDQAEVTHRAAANAFAEAVKASAEHVVEVNRHDAEAFREQVLSLAGRVSLSTLPGDLEAARSSYRGELRNYSQKARMHVTQLREELEAALDAMRTFAQGVSTGTGEHETVLRHEFQQLQVTSESDDVHSIRVAVHRAMDTVTASFDSLKQAQTLVIAQMRDEIRVLQSELERGQRPPDLPAQVEEKRVFDREVDELLRQDRPFQVVFASIPDQRELYEKFPQGKVAGAIAGFVAGLRTIAHLHAPKAVVTAWGEHVYTLVLPGTIQIDDWGRQLAMSHVFQLDGMPRTLRIVPSLKMVEWIPGESPTRYFDRLARAGEALSQPHCV